MLTATPENDVIYDASSSGSSVTSATITRFHTLHFAIYRAFQHHAARSVGKEH